MSMLSADEASSRIEKYDEYIEKVIKGARKNFEDMDFENANRRNEMEDIIDEMERDCRNVQESMNSLWFD